jgi:hypothetical protein
MADIWAKNTQFNQINDSQLGYRLRIFTHQAKKLEKKSKYFVTFVKS